MMYNLNELKDYVVFGPLETYEIYICYAVTLYIYIYHYKLFNSLRNCFLLSLFLRKFFHICGFQLYLVKKQIKCYKILIFDLI